MSNKNRNLIIAYYDTADAADAAALKLKLWDKDHKEIKLGGMGIITLEEGELKTHKVGARAAGTGAKWGTILGAAGGLAAGVLTGGIGLIPGAVVGLGLGTGTGALFHKRVGLTEADKVRLTKHFESGGAALAVMADDYEVEPTKAEIAELGGDVEGYTMPEEIMREVADAHEAMEEAQQKVDVHYAKYDQDIRDDAVLMLLAAPSLSAEDAVELREAEVVNVDDLQETAATAAGRAKMAQAADLSRAEVDAIAYELDLGRVRGIGRKNLKLLKAAGIDSVGDLAEYDADELAGLLLTVNEEEHIVDHMASEDTIAFWIEQAHDLPPYLVAIKVLKEMLDEEAYSWHAIEGDDPKKRRADAIMFNRKEGYEVRLMIQKICNTFGFMTEADVKRIEKVIAEELPGNVRSQENVYNWLVEYFETH